MRALHLIKTANGAFWALHQIRELVRLGVEIHVALPPGGPMVGKYNAVGATEHLLQTDFPISRPWRFPALASKLSSLVKTLKPDLIHSHFVGTTLTMRLTLGRSNAIPRIFQVPGPLHLEHAFFRRAELAMANQMDYWIGTCHWTCKRYLKSGICPKRIFFSHYGTDIHDQSLSCPGTLRKELGLKPGCLVVGMVAHIYGPKRYLGQVKGLKGHEDLIDAFKICLLKSKNADIICVFVGGPWNNADRYAKKLQEYAYRQCGKKIIFLGNRNDVLALYTDFDVAVHPSHSENVGGAVESLLMGIPTITTRVGGFPDLVQDGVTGWLVPPKDPIALAAAIQNALSFKSEAKNGQWPVKSLRALSLTSQRPLSK
jgi:glycosyltransferase involved in cell wall biosynthesis